MEIFVRCTIDEEKLKMAIDRLGCTEGDLVNRVRGLLNSGTLETLCDNEELFSQVLFSINKPLF